MEPGIVADLRAALVARLGNIDDFTIYPRRTDAANVPCAWFTPGRPFADYQQYFRSGDTIWNWVLEIVTNRQDIEAAQELLDQCLDPENPFIARLQAQNVGDALSELTNDFVEVLTADRYLIYKIGGTAYFGIQLAFKLNA